MIHKITLFVYQCKSVNQWLERLNTQLNDPTNQSSLKSPKMLSQQRRKRYYKTLGTGVINSSLSPLWMCVYKYFFIHLKKKIFFAQKLNRQPVCKKNIRIVIYSIVSKPIVCNTMLYMIFHMASNPADIIGLQSNTRSKILKIWIWQTNIHRKKLFCR